jgi:hypothetical protein
MFVPRLRATSLGDPHYSNVDRTRNVMPDSITGSMKLVMKSLAFGNHRLTIATCGRIAEKNSFMLQLVPMENYGLKKIAGKWRETLRYVSGGRSPRDMTLIRVLQWRPSGPRCT